MYASRHGHYVGHVSTLRGECRCQPEVEYLLTVLIVVVHSYSGLLACRFLGL